MYVYISQVVPNKMRCSDLYRLVARRYAAFLKAPVRSLIHHKLQQRMKQQQQLRHTSSASSLHSLNKSGCSTGGGGSGSSTGVVYDSSSMGTNKGKMCVYSTTTIVWICMQVYVCIHFLELYNIRFWYFIILFQMRRCCLRMGFRLTSAWSRSTRLRPTRWWVEPSQTRDSHCGWLVGVELGTALHVPDVLGCSTVKVSEREIVVCVCVCVIYIYSCHYLL